MRFRHEAPGQREGESADAGQRREDRAPARQRRDPLADDRRQRGRHHHHRHHHRDRARRRFERQRVERDAAPQRDRNPGGQALREAAGRQRGEIVRAGHGEAGRGVQGQGGEQRPAAPMTIGQRPADQQRQGEAGEVTVEQPLGGGHPAPPGRSQWPAARAGTGPRTASAGRRPGQGRRSAGRGDRRAKSRAWQRAGPRTGSAQSRRVRRARLAGDARMLAGNAHRPPARCFFFAAAGHEPRC